MHKLQVRIFLCSSLMHEVKDCTKSIEERISYIEDG